MRVVTLDDPSDFDEWRAKARALLLADIEPSEVDWEGGGAGGLFAGADAIPPPVRTSVPAVPRDFLNVASAVLAHTDRRRHATLYRMLWRLAHGEKALLRIATDDDVAWAHTCVKQVSRDMHKMKAFVRFREVRHGEDTVYVAWFEPSFDIVKRVAPFFVRRFTGMHWSLLTPSRTAHWNGETLSFGPGASRADAPTDDALEDLWRTYYASIFNPARLKVDAMRREMPVKYWKNLPEAKLIPGLVRDALPRMQAMVDKQPTIPKKKITPLQKAVAAAPEGSITALRAQARECRACDLWKPATQTVFGEGPVHAKVVVIGEQPGDQEDLAGKPFVGPAGKLFDRALEEAGIERDLLYVTNTVKHFKFEPRGKVRLHKRANAEEQAACRPWLAAEIDRVQPEALVCLGAMAAQAVFGSSFRLMAQRGEWIDLPDGRKAMATVHPSYLLRLPDAEAREAGYAEFVRDLGLMRGVLG
ncbi:MAG: UdgX family uracil-DNA binding protein [Luteibacter sp.]|uniref:UdgX family uracil-DNA binding protein n=1 Tax=Luteibacter sp. TaxID=1886636 RepID=UPI0028079C9B|nr:UdgX family uracil-DNA binding protein [Luteibacter sp.]MDQ7997341.1 UdgX family uracil-DNA binding protein [Luteibacter sp.]MDQ8050428.1 UdgX family uracil-DNA binding protein [Luteibacter sp.]